MAVFHSQVGLNDVDFTTTQTLPVCLGLPGPIPVCGENDRMVSQRIISEFHFCELIVVIFCCYQTVL